MIYQIPIGPDVRCPFCKQGRFAAWYNADEARERIRGTACEHFAGFDPTSHDAYFDSMRNKPSCTSAKATQLTIMP